MNASTETKNAHELSVTQTVAGLLRHYVGARRGLIALAVAAVGTGLYLSWGWLAAVGVRLCFSRSRLAPPCARSACA
jgi:hypothetical protein